MKRIMTTMCGALLFISLLCHPSRSVAGNAYISIDTCDVDQISIFAGQLDGIIKLDLDIGFDSFAMTDVDLEPTAMLFARGDVRKSVSPSGRARMYFVGSEALEGSGIVAILHYQRTSEMTQGRITAAEALATYEDGTPISLPVVINSSPDPLIERKKEAEANAKLQKEQISEAGANEVAGKAQPEDSSGHGGTETTPSPPQEKPYAESGAAGHPSMAAPKKRDEAAESGKRQGRTVVFKSILTSFQELKEERNLAALLKILDQCREFRLRQEPSLALSDGKTVVTVSITLDIKGKRAPVFLLEGARCRDLREFEGNEWEIDLLPDMGVMEASLSVYYDDDRIYGLPIVVAPPLELYASRRSTAEATTQKKIDEYVNLVNRHPYFSAGTMKSIQ